MKKGVSFLAAIMMLFCICASSSSAVQLEDDDAFTLSLCKSGGDGSIQTVTYHLEDLHCCIVDADGSVIYEGPAFSENSSARYSLKAATVGSSKTVYWYPADEPRGFLCGDGIAVSVSVKTNSSVSKTIGLTDGDSSNSTTKNPSAIRYTGTSDYWKFYVENNSSESFNVTGGSLSWGLS